MNKLLVAISVLLLIVLAFSSFFAWQYLSDKNASQNPTPQISTTTPVPSQISTTKKIAYIKDSSLWVIASDGTSKEQLIQKSNSQINSLSWKNSEEISFTKCDESTCQLVTRDMVMGTETVEAEHPQILAVSWNHSGDKLTYIYRLPDGQMKLDLKTTEGTNTIKNFFAGPGRGGSLDDDVSISFSPDDKFILATNTLTVGNPQDKNTIWVIETTSGKEVVTIPISESGWPTQAVWMPNDHTFIYKEGSELKSYNSLSKPVNFLSIGDFYNPTIFHKGGNVLDVYFWINTKTLPYIGSITGGEGTPQTTYKIIDGYFEQQAVDDNHLAALKAQTIINEEAILQFKSSGLSLIDRYSKQVVDLDSGEINMFAVLP